jgi:hypothetical protein
MIAEFKFSMVKTWLCHKPLVFFNNPRYFAVKSFFLLVKSHFYCLKDIKLWVKSQCGGLPKMMDPQNHWVSALKWSNYCNLDDLGVPFTLGNLRIFFFEKINSFACEFPSMSW